MIDQKELAKACLRAGFGKAYLPGEDELKLPNMKPVGRAVAQWASDNNPVRLLGTTGAVVEFVTGSDPAIVDIAMVFGRELMRHGCGVRCVDVQQLLADWDATVNHLYENQYKCVLLEGLASGEPAHYTDHQRGQLEYFCRRWLRSGHGLILLNERAINHATEYTKLFRSTLTRAQAHCFVAA